MITCRSGFAAFSARSPHEFYLRRTGDRVLLYVAEPPSLLEVIDVSDPAAPARVVLWNPKIPAQGNDDIIHSVITA